MKEHVYTKMECFWHVLLICHVNTTLPAQFSMYEAGIRRIAVKEEQCRFFCTKKTFVTSFSTVSLLLVQHISQEKVKRNLFLLRNVSNVTHAYVSDTFKGNP